MGGKNVLPHVKQAVAAYAEEDGEVEADAERFSSVCYADAAEY